jgi:hypothetical protein
VRRPGLQPEPCAGINYLVDTYNYSAALVKVNLWTNSQLMGAFLACITRPLALPLISQAAGAMHRGMPARCRVRKSVLQHVQEPLQQSHVRDSGASYQHRWCPRFARSACSG